ncbi:MAG TPA: hypothetical protein VHB25_20040 [Gemmatimonadaceae bacterium]|nr:hypothetical protein [Gemmatimonadaceae bacterium]
MPTTMGPYTYYPVEFTKDGDIYKPPQLDAVLAAVAPAAGLTDLFVISHGWNNDIADAEDLYTRIFTQVNDVLAGQSPACANVRARRAAVVGILWPSKKFAEKDLIPGGAAGLDDGTGALSDGIDTLSAFLDSPDAAQSLARAKTLVDSLADDMDARDEFVRIVRAFMPHDVNDEEPAVPNDLFVLGGDELLQRLSRPGRDQASGGGGAAGFGDWMGKAINGARSLVNLVTYYQMKNRAGVIGEKGAYDMLRQIRVARPADPSDGLRLHLIGHSFGCRLVTAATAGPAGTPPLPIDSLTLLQAAFSHYGFAQAYDGTHDGYFRRVVTDPTRVRGPVLISFTSKDLAVGLAYPIASRIARQIASAFGDANDPYGGMGRNGAQKTPGSVVVTMAPPGTAYTFAARGIYNLDANAVIGGHSDLAHPQVAYALLSGVAVT